MIRPIRDGSQKRSTCFRNISIERSDTSIRSFKKIKHRSVLRQESLCLDCHSGLDPESIFFNLDSRFCGNDAFGNQVKKHWTHCSRLCSIIKAITFCTLLTFLLLNFSCEREKEVVSQSHIRTNGLPVITSINISPQNPNKNSDLDITIQSQDPDGDLVMYHYQWIKNNEEISGENINILKSGNFKKGDLIQVKVIPSDEKVEGQPFLSEQIRILNSPPVIQEVQIEPKMAYATDSLRVNVKSDDIDGDSVYYSYRWEKNGEVLTEEKKEVLEKGQFRKGDLIAVTVTPDDRESQGVSKKSEPITILNSPPIIISSPPTSVEGSDYVYQVKAYDPDDDPISFKLKSAPKGMEIDQATGLVRWTIQSKDKGTHSIEIEASDQEGAKSFQRFVLNVEIR
jgi:hypothetical protein